MNEQTGRLMILAMDHRNSLERDLYGLDASPTLGVTLASPPTS
jgi:hypothetical protein